MNRNSHYYGYPAPFLCGVVMVGMIVLMTELAYASQYKVTITQPPQNVTVCEGQTVTLSVQATTDFPNPQMAYRWLKDNQTIQDGGKYSGSTTNTLTITNITQAEAGQYTIEVSVTNGNVQPATAIATVIVDIAPTITSQPQNVTGCEDDQASVSVQATGVSLSYQWYVVGMGPIPGATNNTLSQQLTMLMNGIRVYSTITSQCGTLSSDTIVVTVNAKTRISQQPRGGTVDRNGSLTLTVTASGTNLRYQWRKNGQNIGGATSSQYTISNFSSQDVGDYDCVITGDCGSVTSDIAIVRASSIEDQALAAGYRLSIEPLPVNDRLILVMTTPQSESVMIDIVDMTGRTVATLWNGVTAGAEQRVDANVATLSTGVYRCVLRSKDYRLSTALVIVR